MLLRPVESAIGWFKYRALAWTAVAPVLVVLTNGLVVLSIPPKCAFTVSEGSLTTAASDCSETVEDKRIGLYNVLSLRPVDSGCLFFIEGGLFDWIGLDYLPDDMPHTSTPNQGLDIKCEEFDGHWYRFVQRW